MIDMDLIYWFFAFLLVVVGSFVIAVCAGLFILYGDRTPNDEQ